jgi:hypothetical protein
LKRKGLAGRKFAGGAPTPLALVLEVVENAAAVVAGLKAERARKAVAEVGRARTRAVMVRGADIAAVEERRESGEAVVVVMWRRRVQYAGDVAVVLESKASRAPRPISVGRVRDG